MTTEYPSDGTILESTGLSVNYSTEQGAVQALRDVSLEIQSGETMGIAGESGSGKSTLALAILQYLGKNGNITGGEIRFKGKSLTGLSDRQLRGLRGNRIAHVPQDPKTSLNPSIRAGEQIAETLREHQDLSKDEAFERAVSMLDKVNVSDPRFNAKKYPHQLSGGMQQRVLIAMALVCKPDLLILDEPTTGLDVTTQSKILTLIEELKEDFDTSILLITHDLGVIAQVADRVCILYAGEIMERGSVEEVFTNPANPYTQGLLAALPRIESTAELKPIRGQIPNLIDIGEGCIFAERCSHATDECTTGTIAEYQVEENSGHTSKCLHWESVLEEPIEIYAGESSGTVHETGDELITADDVKRYFGSETFFDQIFGGEPPVKAVDGVDLEVRESETMAVVGESGCGKSTLGKALIRVLELTDGSVTFRGEDVASMSGADLKEFRSESQIVFQNPHSSLNPRHSVKTALSRPLKLYSSLDPSERRDRIIDLLERVGLSEQYMGRYPEDLSGGEKQRVAIARAFAAEPSFVVLDEPVSALDTSVQASILNLLAELREEYGTSYLFISHDLSVVNYISNRVAVMYLGNLVEVGETETIFEPPYHPYTRALLSSIPSPNPMDATDRINLEGDVPSARHSPSGCPFHTRCPQKIGDVCENEVPPLEQVDVTDDETHRIACHLDEEEMLGDINQ